MEKLIYIFEQAKNKNQLISLLSKNQEWEDRRIGFVLSYDDKKVVIQELDNLGKKKKQKEILISKISVIEFADEYMHNLLQMHQSNVDFRQGKAKYLNFTNKPTKIKRLIELCKSAEICTFMVSNDNYLTGFITEVMTDGLLIQCVGYDGNYDGIAIINLDRLEQIRTAGTLEKKIAFLSNLPNKRKLNWE